MFSCIFTYLFICVYIYVYIDIWVWIYMYVYIYIWIHDDKHDHDHDHADDNDNVIFACDALTEILGPSSTATTNINLDIFFGDVRLSRTPFSPTSPPPTPPSLSLLPLCLLLLMLYSPPEIHKFSLSYLLSVPSWLFCNKISFSLSYARDTYIVTTTSRGLDLSVFCPMFHLSHLVTMHHVLSDSIP